MSLNRNAKSWPRHHNWPTCPEPLISRTLETQFCSWLLWAAPKPRASVSFVGARRNQEVILFIWQSRLKIQLSYLGDSVTSTVSVVVGKDEQHLGPSRHISPLLKPYPSALCLHDTCLLSLDETDDKICQGCTDTLTHSPLTSSVAALLQIVAVSRGARLIGGLHPSPGSRGCTYPSPDAPQYHNTAGTELIPMFPLLKTWRPTEKSQMREVLTTLPTSQDKRRPKRRSPKALALAMLRGAALWVNILLPSSPQLFKMAPRTKGSVLIKLHGGLPCGQQKFCFVFILIIYSPPQNVMGWQMGELGSGFHGKGSSQQGGPKFPT